MLARKLKVTIGDDHRVEAQLPEDFPPGPAEVIVLSEQGPAASPEGGAPRPDLGGALEALEELRSLQRSADEEAALEGFEAFRREHPIRFGGPSSGRA